MLIPSEPENELVDEAEIAACVRVLRAFAASPKAVPDSEEIERLIAKIYKRNRKDRRRQSHDDRVLMDIETIGATGRNRVETGAIMMPSSTDVGGEVFSQLQARSRRCYICHSPYRQVHHFYHWLCPACAEANFSRRTAVVDLTGRRALITGGRIKIGYQTALKLLRCGASVIVTTRFPRDAAIRYASEPDFEVWQDRLQIYQADFRDVPGLLRLVERFQKEVPTLEILINNAAQSVRNSAAYLDRLQNLEANVWLEANQKSLIAVGEKRGTHALVDESATRPIVATTSLALDRHGELIDEREDHSWTHQLGNVAAVDVLETLLINANAPCLLASKLKPLFLRSTFADRYIINVTGLDGQFTRSKSTRHPHVNMSKAALNMLTRTAAQDYVQSGIMMNSVDTGWITHVASYTRRVERREAGFVPPLDEIDGAARIIDPIFRGMQGERLYGQLFRHYQPSNW